MDACTFMKVNSAYSWDDEDPPYSHTDRSRFRNFTRQSLVKEIDHPDAKSYQED